MCRPDWRCYPHQLADVLARLRRHRMAHGADQHVAGSTFDAVLAETADALAAIVADSLGPPDASTRT